MVRSHVDFCTDKAVSSPSGCQPCQTYVCCVFLNIKGAWFEALWVYNCICLHSTNNKFSVYCVAHQLDKEHIQHFFPRLFPLQKVFLWLFYSHPLNGCLSTNLAGLRRPTAASSTGSQRQSNFVPSASALPIVLPQMLKAKALVGFFRDEWATL
jgi:hypothetical protein